MDCTIVSMRIKASPSLNHGLVMLFHFYMTGLWKNQFRRLILIHKDHYYGLLF